ncbi:neprilysin-like isoform X2 [Ruditapes philippinarum]|uniref:neprilysin-like isoform X1 n=1 Tax=Ruditapes philippinarum TaxID=129788 RepID=UPI00295A7D5F|nr:neprilysin-like isoform X1 [Ruditapes philippinarum]XP_060595566.1 neprilysin-like isoform X2 [Ruditapes philippinarum]
MYLNMSNYCKHQIDLGRLIQETMQHVGLTLNQSETAVVRAPAFFEKIGTLLASYSPRVLANYVLSRQVIEKTMFLPKVIRNIRFKYMEALYGSVTEPPRWQTCSDHVKYRLPEVVGRLFVKEAFKNGSRTDVLDLISNLRTSFKVMIGNLKWMDNATKEVAKEKVDHMTSRIGYSDIIYNNTALNELYVNYTITKDNPMKTLINFGQAAVIRQLLNLRKNVNKERWHMSPATVNAYYEMEANQITFPAAILQPPFYSFDQPAYLNYGGIGYVIGHEITHGFDEVGRHYDKAGALNSWWSETNAANFKARAQCFMDQYNNFTIQETGNSTTSGIKSQGENIADNGGIRQSFYAYREWVRTSRRGKEEESLPGMNYTPNQLFFLNAAQIWCEKIRDHAKVERLLTGSHAINMFRVYGPLQNFDEFSHAWNCSAGSFMNPSNKCSVW